MAHLLLLAGCSLPWPVPCSCLHPRSPAAAWPALCQASLHHPNLVRYHDGFIEGDKYLCAVMDLLPAGDLEGVIRCGTGVCCADHQLCGRTSDAFLEQEPTCDALFDQRRCTCSFAGRTSSGGSDCRRPMCGATCCRPAGAWTICTSKWNADGLPASHGLASSR